MSQSSSEPPDGPQPPRQRPPAARAPKDSSELDLWDFDDALDSPAKPEPAELPPATKARPRSLTPEPRTAPPASEAVSSKRTPPAPTKGPTLFDQKRKPADDLGELDDDLPPSEPRVAPSPRPAAEKTVEPVAETNEEPAAPPFAEPEPELGSAQAQEEEIAPTPTPQAPLDIHSLPQRLGLSRIEKIGLVALAAVLVIGGLVLLGVARNRLPIHDSSADYPDYPVKGSLVTVKKLESFWREPVAGKDTVRRDTKLIPVVKVDLEAPPCAIRAFFRNENGETIGDAVTRSTSGGSIELPATAGLEDAAIHASYRTGQTKPWKLELFEAPSADSPRQDFKKLLETPISNDRH
ncbi:hypothetical protein [Luteolibacter sp. LG18]|uniref:hypothetical protein n=1 Tax=Luteolibacter sp. LG18 TaxID=2819286 RepID=UPI002B2E35F1|nr:hypothetical protein llg_02030 [Luteolibacter sp. LG18]